MTKAILPLVVVVGSSLFAAPARAADSDGAPPRDGATPREEPRLYLGGTAGAVLTGRTSYASSWEGVGAKTSTSLATNLFALFRVGDRLLLGPSVWFYSHADNLYTDRARALSPAIRMEYGIDLSRTFEAHALAEAGGLFYFASPGNFLGFEGSGGVGMLARTSRSFGLRLDARLSGYSVHSSETDESLWGSKVALLLGAQAGF